MVSSHLQVLKPFFQDNPECKLLTDFDKRRITDSLGMAYVTPESNESEKVEHFSINPMKRSESFDVGDGQPSPYLNPLPPPSEIIPSSQRFSIRRINFEMYILGPELEKLHVYTSLQSETGSASKRLEDIPDWQSKFPQMASYYDRGSSHEEIILFETSFKLMNNHPPIKQMGCQAPLRSKLGVDFDVDIDQGSDYMNWECHSNFYEQGVLKESLGTSTKSEDLSSGEARVVVLHLSQWWVNRFTKIIKGRLQKEQAGDLDAMQHDAERARRQIQDVTAIQEIWATPKAGGSSRKRTAVFLWSFRQCQDHEAPTTAWRKVIPPAIKPELYSPIQASAPLFHQPPMVVDTVQRHHDLLQLTPLYAEYFNPQPFYGENSEKFFAGLDSRLGSPSLVPGVDSQSFQSATSDCLPSSIHSSAFPIETPHGSSFGSQEPMLHPEGSVYSLQEMGFNSQDSIYPSQELECPSEEPPTRSSHTPLFTPHAPIESQESSHASQDYYYQMQEGVAQSEETEYPSSVSQCQSDYPRHDSIVNHCNGDMSPPIQDFSGMHIQLSYATPEEEMSTYGTPYIAPPGSMEASQENCHVEYESHSQEELPDHDEGQHQEPLDLEQWQAMDQAVRWANAQFSNGEYEEVGDLLKNSEPVMEGDIGDLQSDIDVELQSGIDVDLPSGIGVELQGVEVDLQSVADVDLGML